MIKEEITKERIEDRINDLEISARMFVEDLEAFAMQQALKQMQVKDDNTDLIDEAEFCEIKGFCSAKSVLVKSEVISDSLHKLRNAWFTMRRFTDDEVKKILENSANKLNEMVKEQIKKMEEKEAD